jgi:hypothetical protein
MKGDVKIVSDGTAPGTKITVDGVELRCVTAISWQMSDPSWLATSSEARIVDLYRPPLRRRLLRRLRRLR